MNITSKQEEEIKNDLVDNGMYYCNRCETFFIVRNTNDGIIHERVCPCCGVISDDAIESVEIVEQ